MAHRIELTATRAHKSRLARYAATINGFRVYAHTYKGIMGPYVLFYNENEWRSFEVFHEARTEALRYTRAAVVRELDRFPYESSV